MSISVLHFHPFFIPKLFPFFAKYSPLEEPLEPHEEDAEGELEQQPPGERASTNQRPLSRSRDHSRPIRRRSHLGEPGPAANGAQADTGGARAGAGLLLREADEDRGGCGGAGGRPGPRNHQEHPLQGRGEASGWYYDSILLISPLLQDMN